MIYGVFLVNRGYEKDFVENQFSRAREVDRFNLFDRGEKNEQSNGVNLVIDYHPALRCLYGIFKELQSVVNLSAVLGKIIPKEPMICYRRPKNLKDHLVRAKLRRMDEVVVGCLNAKVKGVKCAIQLLLEIRLEVRRLGEFLILITALIAILRGLFT